MSAPQCHRSEAQTTLRMLIWICNEVIDKSHSEGRDSNVSADPDIYGSCGLVARRPAHIFHIREQMEAVIPAIAEGCLAPNSSREQAHFRRNVPFSFQSSVNCRRTTHPSVDSMLPLGETRGAAPVSKPLGSGSISVSPSASNITSEPGSLTLMGCWVHQS